MALQLWNCISHLNLAIRQRWRKLLARYEGNWQKDILLKPELGTYKSLWKPRLWLKIKENIKITEDGDVVINPHLSRKEPSLQVTDFDKACHI